MKITKSQCHIIFERSFPLGKLLLLWLIAQQALKTVEIENSFAYQEERRF